MLSDLGGSVAAVGAGLATVITGWDRADPLLSLAIVALVVVGAVWLLRETAGILMARVPPASTSRPLPRSYRPSTASSPPTTCTAG